MAQIYTVKKNMLEQQYSASHTWVNLWTVSIRTLSKNAVMPTRSWMLGTCMHFRNCQSRFGVVSHTANTKLPNTKLQQSAATVYVQ